MKNDLKYRFWGSKKPTAELAAGVRAEVRATEDGSGRAVIRIYDPIDSWGGYWGVSAKDFAETLDNLDPSVDTIELHINSPGGSAFEAVAIANLLRRHSARIVAYVDGIAASAASLLACSADETIMSPNSELMIHDAWDLVIGDAAEMRKSADLLDKVSGNLAGIYAKKAGVEVSVMRDAMLAETWYTDEEAVEAGLADKVDSTDVADTDAQSAQNRFDLTIFAHAGRQAAPAPAIPESSVATPEPPSAAAAGSVADVLSALDAFQLDLELLTA